MGRPAADGAMGIHYFRPDLLGITAPPAPRVNGTGMHTDFRNPAILIYEPQADGSLDLVAVENLVSRCGVEGRRAHSAANVPWCAGRLDGGRSEDGVGRSAHVRAALRPTRLDLPGEPERCLHAVQPSRVLCCAQRKHDSPVDPCFPLTLVRLQLPDVHQHTELCQALHAPPEPGADSQPARPVRRCRRRRDRPFADLSDVQPAEPSDFRSPLAQSGIRPASVRSLCRSLTPESDSKPWPSG